jgi:hypothetical protein
VYTVYIYIYILDTERGVVGTPGGEDVVNFVMGNYCNYTRGVGDDGEWIIYREAKDYYRIRSHAAPLSSTFEYRSTQQTHGYVQTHTHAHTHTRARARTRVA